MREKAGADNDKPFRSKWSAWLAEQNRKNEERASKPDNVVVLKFAVALCYGLLIWCYYVYVGRICTPMIRQDLNARGSKIEGILFLVFFNLLWLMMVYTYTLVIATPPGYVKDHVKPGPRAEPPPNWIPSQAGLYSSWHPYPQIPQRPGQQLHNGMQQASLEGLEGGSPSNRPRLFTDVNDNTNQEAVGATTASQGQELLAGPPYSNIAPGDLSQTTRGSDYSTTAGNGAAGTTNTTTAVGEERRPAFACPTTASLAEDPQVVADKMPKAGALGPGVANAVAAINPGTTHNFKTDSSTGPTSSSTEPAYINDNEKQPQHSNQNHNQPYAPSSSHVDNRNGYNYGGPNQDVEAYHHNQPQQRHQFPRVFREPPARLPLHPHTLYCERCQSIKLPRAHHCRHCGTCVLGMDHHCPWIGQCCGARNHHLFVSFCFWSCIALGYIFVTMLIALIAPNATRSPNSLDVQGVVICAIAAVLSFFTGSMCVTHAILIMNGQSTIENVSIGDMKRRETAALNRAYPFFAFKAKKQERFEMDQIWGKLNSEANLWFQGSKKKNWEMVMGYKKLHWFLPSPWYRPDSGLAYTPNPRRGEDGRWRPRQEWPEELR